MKALLVNNEQEKPVMEISEYPDPEPAEGELLVKVEATALNRADLLQKSGKYPPPEGESEILGLEMSGTVVETGEGADRFRTGDRVYGLLGGGGYAEYCTVHEEHAMPVPDELSFEEAAALPEVFLTAWQALYFLGDLKEKETVLIHAGASGVGTAAIQLANKVSLARIIATAGSGDKLELCRSLGAGLAVNYKEKNFSEVIRSRYGNDSVDLIIDFVGSPYWEMNIESLAVDGRVVYLSMLGGVKVKEMSLIPILRKRLTIRGSTLRNRSAEYKSNLVQEFHTKCGELIRSGEIRPVIDSVYNWSDAEDAHERMKNSMNAGKIVLNGM